MELCVVNTTEMQVYCFTGEDSKNIDLDRANQTRINDIETWAKHCETYPDREDLKQYLKSAQNKQYEIMTFDEFLEAERNSLLGGELIEISEEEFQDALNVLPPLKWCNIDGVEMFCMCEMLTGSYTAQYARKNDKYYTKTVDVRDSKTWINNLLK